MTERRRINLALPQFGEKYDVEKMRRLVEEIERLAMRGGGRGGAGGGGEPVPGPAGPPGPPGSSGPPGPPGEVIAGAFSVGTHYFVQGFESDIESYDVATICPADIETSITKVLTNGDNLIGVFSTSEDMPGLCVIDHGTWVGHVYYRAAEASGSNVVRIEIYKRSAGGAETHLMNVSSESLNSTSPAESMFEYEQTKPIKIETDERIVYKIFVERSGGDMSFTMRFNGHENPSHIHTPFVPMAELSGNLGQIADLDCCGVIVRDCESETEASCALADSAPAFVTRPPSWSKGNTVHGRLIGNAMWQVNTDYGTAGRITVYNDGVNDYINRHIRSLNTDAAGWPLLLEETHKVIRTWSSSVHAFGGGIIGSHRFMYIHLSNSGNQASAARIVRDNTVHPHPDLTAAALQKESGVMIDHAIGGSYQSVAWSFYPGKGLFAVATTNPVGSAQQGLWLFHLPGETEGDVNLAATPVALKLSSAGGSLYRYCLGLDQETGHIIVADNSNNLIYEVASDMSAVVSQSSVLPTGQSATIRAPQEPILLFGGKRIGFAGIRTGGYLQNFLEYEKNVDGDWALFRNTNIGQGIGDEAQTTGLNTALADCLVYFAQNQYVYTFCEEVCEEGSSSGPKFRCAAVIGKNGIKVENGRGQGGGDIIISMDVDDCCGIIVRDCTTYAIGGEWEYSNFQMTKLAERDTFGNTATIDIVGPTFEGLSDNRITAIEGGWTLDSAGDTFNWHVLNNELEIVSTHVVSYAGDYYADGVGVLAGDYQTKQISASGVGSGGALVLNNGAYARVLTYDEASGWPSWYYAESWNRPEYGGLHYWRPGGYYFGVRKTGSTPTNFNRIMKFPNPVPAVLPPPATWQETLPVQLGPSAVILDVDEGSGTGTAGFAFYVTPSGDRVWTLESSASTNPGRLREYDSSLALLNTYQIPSALVDFVSGSSGNAGGFGVLGNFLFLVYRGVLRLIAIDTMTQLAASVSLGNSTHRYPTRVLPHPDGLVYATYRGGSDPTGKIFVFRWAEANYLEEQSESLGWRCMELQTVGGSQSRITIQNPAAQGGDPIFDLREVEQAEGGTPKAITVDAWGRVVESRALVAADIEPFIPESSPGVLPMTTGEVPPVLVYGPDGSLIYYEVS